MCSNLRVFRRMVRFEIFVMFNWVNSVDFLVELFIRDVV